MKQFLGKWITYLQAKNQTLCIRAYQHQIFVCNSYKKILLSLDKNDLRYFTST